MVVTYKGTGCVRDRLSNDVASSESVEANDRPDRNNRNINWYPRI